MSVSRYQKHFSLQTLFCVLSLGLVFGLQDVSASAERETVAPDDNEDDFFLWNLVAREVASMESCYIYAGDESIQMLWPECDWLMDYFGINSIQKHESITAVFFIFQQEGEFASFIRSGLVYSPESPDHLAEQLELGGEGDRQNWIFRTIDENWYFFRYEHDH